MQVPSLGKEDPLEKEMATHSSILGWRVLWTEEPGSLQSMELQRVGHNLANKHTLQLGRKVMANLKAYLKAEILLCQQRSI